MALSDVVIGFGYLLALVGLCVALWSFSRPLPGSEGDWYYNERRTLRLHNETGELQHLFEGRWVSYGDGNLGGA